MEYYYIPKDKIDLEKNLLVIDNFEYDHLIKVLRKKKGDLITLTDGELNIYRCEIVKVEREKLLCSILKKDYNLFEPSTKTILYLSPLRNLARFEFAVEKAVELGVTSIYPVITENTVNKNPLSKSKHERLNKIIIGAMGQSQRCFLPGLYDTITFAEMLSLTKEKRNKIIMYESSNDTKEYSPDRISDEINLLIGPEGGFSKEEISSLLTNSWQAKSLGRRKLRAETAAIVSLYEVIKSNS